MHCLAVCELAGGVLPDGEADPLAEALGVTPYDVRVRLAGVLPKVMRQSDDVGELLGSAERIRARGHGTIVFDGNDALPLERMTSMRRFGAEGGLLYANDRRPPSRPFADLVAIVQAAMSVHVVRTTTEIVLQHTGRGTIRKREVRQGSEYAPERLAVLFWRDGAPWLLRQSEARFVALGDRIRPTVHENFTLALEWLRARAENAVYDDRFVGHPLTPQRSVGTRDAESARPLGSDRAIELPLHALGAWLSRQRGGPYR